MFCLNTVLAIRVYTLKREVVFEKKGGDVEKGLNTPATIEPEYEGSPDAAADDDDGKEKLSDKDSHPLDEKKDIDTKGDKAV
jgi:hypothetical protein